MSREKQWSEMDYDERVRVVFKLAHEGLIAKQIGARLNIDPQHVYALARSEGFSISSPYSAWPKKDEAAIGFTSSPDPWGRSPDTIREANWRRARNAARERLNAIDLEELQAIASIENAAPESLPTANENSAVDNVENLSNDPFLRALRRQIA